jgi:biopolymer transport protein TolQ
VNVLSGLLLPALPVADFITAFRMSSFVSGKLIVIILFVFSILAWSVMTAKWVELKRAAAGSAKFLAAFRNEAHPLSLYVKNSHFNDSPLFKVYEAGCIAIGGELNGGSGAGRDLFEAGGRLEGRRLTPFQIEVVRRATERTVADQALELESKMGLLATAVSASPMLGLLGTVWGVLDAFGAMAAVGAANLAAVAPGISAALLTTVVGLLVAIPSAIGYNLLASRIRKLAVQMDNFAQEFVAALQRTFVDD